MPIYEYECDKCHYIFEEIIFGSDSDVVCPKCESKHTRKLMSASSAIGQSKGLDSLGAMASMGGSSCGSGGFS